MREYDQLKMFVITVLKLYNSYWLAYVIVIWRQKSSTCVGWSDAHDLLGWAVTAFDLADDSTPPEVLIDVIYLQITHTADILLLRTDATMLLRSYLTKTNEQIITTKNWSWLTKFIEAFKGVITKERSWVRKHQFNISSPSFLVYIRI